LLIGSTQPWCMCRCILHRSPVRAAVTQHHALSIISAAAALDDSVRAIFMLRAFVTNPVQTTGLIVSMPAITDRFSVAPSDKLSPAGRSGAIDSRPHRTYSARPVSACLPHVVASVCLRGCTIRCDTMRYDARCYFNVRSKADTSQLNPPHGTNN